MLVRAAQAVPVKIVPCAGSMVDRRLLSVETGMAAWEMSRAAKPTLWDMRDAIMDMSSSGDSPVAAEDFMQLYEDKAREMPGGWFDKWVLEIGCLPPQYSFVPPNNSATCPMYL